MKRIALLPIWLVVLGTASATVLVTRQSGGGSAPVNSSPPTVGASPVDGTLTASTVGAWTNSPTSFACQWTANAIDIPGATSCLGYTPITTQVGAVLRIRVVASNGAGPSSPATSAPSSAVAPIPADVYVATTGNDTTGNGSWAAPYATLGRAKTAVRSLITSNANASYTVLMRGGSYPATASTVFVNADKVSDGNFVTYRGTPSERPIIEGGYRISGWTNNGDGTWSRDLVAAGLWPGPATGGNAGYYFGSIWVNGVRRFHPIVPDRGTLPFYTVGQVAYQTGVGPSDAATFVSGSPNITVSDISHYVDVVKVNFGSSTFGGLVAGRQYRVIVNNHTTNVIQLQDTVTSATFTPSASTSPTIPIYYNQAVSTSAGDNYNNPSTNAFGYDTTHGTCPAASADMCPAWAAGLTGDEKVEIYTTYGSNMIPVWDITASNVILKSRLMDGGHGAVIVGTPYRRRNFPQDIGQPGHFYLTRAGVITYAPMPGEDMTTAEIWAPFAKELIRISNAPADGWTGGATQAGNLKFIGMDFRHTNSVVDTCEFDRRMQSCSTSDSVAGYFVDNGAIAGIGLRNVVWDGVHVEHTQEAGIKPILGSNNWTVQNSYFNDIGGTGIAGGGGYTATNSYQYSTLWGGAATTPSTAYYKYGDADASNLNDGSFTITNNEFTETGAHLSMSPAITNYSSNNMVVTHNYIHDTFFNGLYLAIAVNPNALDSNEQRNGYVAWNRAVRGGNQKNTAGAWIAGYACHNDIGMRYSFGNLGGLGGAGQTHIEEYNVYSDWNSCPFQTTGTDAVTANGYDGIACYFDGISSFNFTFRHNICANGSERLLQLTGLYGVLLEENIFYGSFTKGKTNVRQANMFVAVPPSANPGLGPPPAYPGAGPTYARVNRNVFAVTTNGAISTANYFANGTSGASYSVDAPAAYAYSQFVANLYWKYDSPPMLYFGEPATKTFAFWQAITGGAGALQDIGAGVGDPNFQDTSFSSSRLFSSSGGAPLCSDGVQRSPACGLPGGFTLWDPTQAGLIP